MYIPDAFLQSDLGAMHGLMRRYSFATVVSGGAGGLVASHLPVLLDGSRGAGGTLRSHMARSNPQWQGFEGGGEVLVIFEGPHGYVSPSWYETKVAVPTWNYAVVHAYGRPRLIEEAALRTLLADTVRAYEGERASRWEMSRLPGEVLEKLERQIVGFEIEITRIEGKWKLGQNRTAADRAGAVAGLRAEGQEELARWMEGVTGS